MKDRIERRGLAAGNRTLAGILAATIVMSQLSGTGLVVRAAESDLKPEVIETEEEDLEIISQAEELITQEETSTEAVTVEQDMELESEEIIQEEYAAEEVATEEITDEETVSVGVYLQFDPNGGSCDISMIVLTPDNMELTMPQAQKTGAIFTGWYLDQECTIAFEESDILWEAGRTYVLYAGYEQPDVDEVKLMERILQQSMNGVTISVEGNMPEEATLEVRAEELSKEEQINIAAKSDMINSQEELESEENTCYSYDITLRYQDVEYEPYLFDEKMEVTFSFSDEQELQNSQQMEVFHIDDNQNVEKIEIKEVSEREVCFEADAFSTYILITQIEYVGNKSWTYGFTGDVQTFTAPVSGQYVFECYGAGTEDSKGSFAKGTIGLEKAETVYIYVGGQNNAFNGAGTGGAVWHTASNSEGRFERYIYSDAGCGATDVRVGAELESRLIVAGGGAGNGHEGGVWYSYNGSYVTGGPGYNAVKANNSVNSNQNLGVGEDYSTSISAGNWGWGDSYPTHGTYNVMTVNGGGGGGYYGGKAGYAGTSKVIADLLYEEKEYSAVDSVVENLIHTGDGKCQVSLYSLEADVITYYNYNMTTLGEAAGLTGNKVDFPILSAIPQRASDAMYDYTFLGWDDMATETIEYYTDAETVEAALQGDRNYIAAYECVGKSYTVVLDSADAQFVGTPSIMATYHSALPDIVIPIKEGSVFAGYFTGQNGTGTQIYSAEGKGLGLSEIEQESVLYAHWVQPIVKVTGPEDQEVLAGYAGVVLTTEVELCQPTGYALTYQWYMNHVNSTEKGSQIEAADTRKLVIPQGFQPGKYYFYCLVTATNVLNGQAVSIYTEPALLSVEKGIMGMEQVEIETIECIYDGTARALRAAINNSNPYTVYYGVEPLTGENYQEKGTTEPNYYTDAGKYSNYVYVTGSDFADFSGSIEMTIHKAEPHVYLSSKNTTYTGQVQMIDRARVYDVNDREMEMLVAYVYFMDEACTQKTDSSCGALSEGGAPSAVGTYYVHAVTEETVNYLDVATKTPAMFNILGANVTYSISGYHGMYDGKPHGLQVINEDEANATIYFSDSVMLTEDNYQMAGTQVPYEYTEVGKYSISYIVVKKLAGGINQYDTGMAEIVIEEAVHSETEKNPTSNQPSDNQGSSTAGNKESGSSQDEKRDEGEKQHKHNYELVSFEEPTSDQEGKAVYRCGECGHELVITYPATGKEENSSDLDEENNTEAEKKEKLSDKKQTIYVNQTEDEHKAVTSLEKEKKTFTEAELLKMAKALKNLSEDEIRDLYEKGLLNLTAQELERLLSMIRAQVTIDEEQVSLSENAASDEENENADNDAEKETRMWNILWAFLLGAAVMFLIREIMGVQKKKRSNQTAAPTRKLSE